MSQTTSNSAGSAVEAQSGPEVADRPMFYAAEAMEFLSDVQYRLGDQLAGPRRAEGPRGRADLGHPR